MADTATSPDLVLAHLDSLPTLPSVALRLLEVTMSRDSAAEDVIQILRRDPSLTAKVLSLASSAALGARDPVKTLERAVPLLGFATIRSLALATSVFECFSGRSGQARDGGFEPAEFWKHSLAVACAARRLAALRSELQLDPEDAFVAGLLHDLGKVALNTVFPKAYDRIVAQVNHGRGDIADSERVVLGVDHTVAGRRLAERWRLPRELQETIWLHHLTSEALPAAVGNLQLIGLVQLADTLAREQRLGYSGNYTFYEFSPQQAERLGFSPEDLAATVGPLTKDLAEHALLLGLDGETAEQVYVQAMTRANTELGRLNTELLASNRRLAAGARYFQAITHFEQVLGDWSDPGEVVQALAGAAAGALQRPRMAAFGLRANGSAVDLAWYGPQPEKCGQQTRPLSTEFEEWLAKAGERETQAQPAPPVIRGLLPASAFAADNGNLWLLPMWHGTGIIGGVVYLSDTDERSRLASEAEDLRSFLASVALALGRANAQAAARRLSEDLAQTNRRLQQMQAELLRSRTLSMIAEMAAGAGHELNGPLTVISGRAQMLAGALDDPETQRVLRAIVEKAHECSAIVSELMDFARPRSAQLAAVDVSALLGEVREQWLRESGLAASQVFLEPRGGAPPRGGKAVGPTTMVLADREQLRTVFRELLSNATDAIQGTAGSIRLRWQPALEADTLEVVVEDTGCGMAPTVMQRAFDPFFSHRQAGRRRGLGLPRAYRIIESHGGRIWLESRPDEGTTVHVLLPRAGGDSPSKPA